MAIQNFLSGGFYGSIGEITGRRWKNKRVVQEKFKPKNPKTPAQERQRKLFTRGSALAKIGQQVNWKAPQFDSPIKTDWNMRQTVAINALKDGQSEWEALPLAPKGFIAQHKIGTCTLEEITEDNVMKVVFEGTDLLPGKKYACAIFIQSGNKKGQIIVGSTSEASVDALTASFRLPESDGIKGEEVYIKIASIDDTTTETVTLSAGILLQQEKEIPYEFNPSIVSVTAGTNGTLQIKVKLGEEPIESYDAIEFLNCEVYGKIWLKETAVNVDKLDEENAEAIRQTMNKTSYSVAKSTAIVTFTVNPFAPEIIEKYDCKFDLSFNANAIKGKNTVENTEEISLTAQTFPEYMQDEFTFDETTQLWASAKENTDFEGFWSCIGEAYINKDKTETGKLVAINEEFAGGNAYLVYLNSITLQNGTVLKPSEPDEYFEEYDPISVIDGTKIGWGLQTDLEMKSFSGRVGGELYCEGNLPKFAIAGYRTITVPNEFNKTIDCIFNG